MSLPNIVFDVNETLLDLETMTPIFERIFGWGRSPLLLGWISTMSPTRSSDDMRGPRAEFLPRIVKASFDHRLDDACPCPRQVIIVAVDRQPCFIEHAAAARRAQPLAQVHAHK